MRVSAEAAADLAQTLAVLAYFGFLQDGEPEWRTIEEASLFKRFFVIFEAIALFQLSTAQGFDLQCARHGLTCG